MALSPDEKFIYVNPDTTAGEYNLAQYFPVKYIRGLECANAANFYVYFRGPKDAKSTRLTVSLTSGFIKEFFTQFVDEINFGEKSVITLADRNVAVNATTGGTDFQHVNAYIVPVILSDALTSGYEDVQITEDLDVGGTITGDLTGDVTGNADTATLAADATTLATPRAIFGHDFDGSAALTGVIASANLDADTAHLTTTQTFSGAKTFSANAALAGIIMDGNTITGVDDSGEFTDDDAHIMTSAAINDRIAAAGGGTVGWHGSGTRIKILPKDFVPNDGGRPIMIEDDSIGSNELFLFSHGSFDMFAYIPIPTGFKATHTRIYGSDTGQTFTTYESDIDSKTIAIKGTATAIGTEKAITNVTSDTTNYLVIQVTSDGASDEIHGGYVTITAV